jgi:hypothetical protein
VVRCVATVFDAWCAVRPAGAEESPGTGTTTGRAAVLAAADAAGRRGGEELRERLRLLLMADVDAQHATPLELVRGAVAYPTEVLRGAGVPPVERDRFAAERFPDDTYGLTPASLATVDPALTEVSVRWGAAKAAAHRRRHA